MTRDSLLPLIAPLAQARAKGVALSQLVADQPARFTAADRLQEVPTEASQTLVQSLIRDAAVRDAFTAPLGGAVTDLDTTDGVRMTLESGRILHLRPSGNAPELRLYVEESDRITAERVLRQGLAHLQQRLAAARD